MLLRWEEAGAVGPGATEVSAEAAVSAAVVAVVEAEGERREDGSMDYSYLSILKLQFAIVHRAFDEIFPARRNGVL